MNAPLRSDAAVPTNAAPAPPDATPAGWHERLAEVVETVREMSSQTDPQAMVRNYGARLRKILPTDMMISVSRRDLPAPMYRITRCSLWEEEVNPWKDIGRLPLIDHGVLGELLYSNEPHFVNHFEPHEDDPAFSLFAGMGAMIALPLFDQGESLNMVFLFREQPGSFDPEEFPNNVLTSNLFGRATHNLVLRQQLQDTYALVDHELQTIAAIQRSLLPAQLPRIPTMQLAAHYATSANAGGDYYDFFELPDGMWGILIADVSGHGTPAAVVMAITHAIAHSYLGPPTCPGKMLDYLNERLCRAYTIDNRTFVTAFYGIYDPATRELKYSSAGHHPPRVKRCEDGSIFSLDGPGGLPLGLFPEATYEPSVRGLRPGDQVILYTDGITESMNSSGEMFDVNGLDGALENCMLYASDLIQRVLDAVEAFTGGLPPEDDRTVLVAKIE